VDLKQLEYFLAVFEEGSFSKPAARINSTQPSISVQIAALEQALNCISTPYESGMMSIMRPTKSERCPKNCWYGRQHFYISELSRSPESAVII
jgi:hypothetical protein